MINTIILCVEDNKHVQMLNKLLLENKGFMVKQAMTIAEAQEEVRREIPGLIILDMHLPDGCGLSFLRELRKTSDVPVIALTNNNEERCIVEDITSGYDYYISKPYNFFMLYTKIKSVLCKDD